MQHLMNMTRLGVFKVKPSQGTKCQCVVKGHTTYYYKAVVTFRDPVLDKRGFLIDHADLDRFITGYYKNKPIPSCEVMVRTLAEHVANWLKKQHMPAFSVFIQLASIPEGSQGYVNTTYFPE